jgi:hypothetical protein
MQLRYRLALLDNVPHKSMTKTCTEYIQKERSWQPIHGRVLQFSSQDGSYHLLYSEPHSTPCPNDNYLLTAPRPSSSQTLDFQFTTRAQKLATSPARASRGSRCGLVLTHREVQTQSSRWFFFSLQDCAVSDDIWSTVKEKGFHHVSG